MPELPEWNTEALGQHKWERGHALAHELIKRLSPGAALLHRMGKHYPGESMPRWALEIIGRTDGRSLWSDDVYAGGTWTPTVEDARRMARAIAMRLGFSDRVIDAYEDPWRFIEDEANLPVGVDPLEAALDDPEERRRLARVLGRGLGLEAGFVLPLARAPLEGTWLCDRWEFRRGHLFLIPGDSPMGLRLPLRSLGPGLAVVPFEEAYQPPDPRTAEADGEDKQHKRESAKVPVTSLSHGVRTALCVEPRGDKLFVFLPPLASAEDFFDLVAIVDRSRRDIGTDVVLEGYPPPPSPKIRRFSVTPDPGVIEVNIPPTRTTHEYAEQLDKVFDAALHAGLHSEKYLIDGRQAGSGGGNHLTFGGPTPLTSPFVQRPELLASLITFFQHHPSLSYMFAGLFVGPTSQHPRLDEARHDSLYAGIALRHAFDLASRKAPTPPPWLSDMLFRHLLVDLSGNTHRAEICIDKLFSPEGAHGRQGIVELRPFEMPPHIRMAAAQMILMRSLLTAFAHEVYDAPLARYGQMLHDRFLLPYWMGRDFEDVLTFLSARGLPLPADGYRPFLELRCPVVGTLPAGDVQLQIRNAIEPWNVLGEELTTTGTSRYVDSSVERLEVLADGIIAERHRVLVNGQMVPLTPTGKAGQYVAGVRFRAWAPPHSLHAHIGIHHPLQFDVHDTWGKRSLGALAYHVWHPEGRGYDAPPLTRFEAAARTGTTGHLLPATALADPRLSPRVHIRNLRAPSTCAGMRSIIRRRSRKQAGGGGLSRVGCS